MSKQRIMTAAALALSTLAPTVGALAQERQPARVRVETTTQTQDQNGNVIISRTRTPNGPGPDVFVERADGQDDTFVFVSSEMSIDGKVVKGAPYSAQAVTEMVQTLGDGNRIVRKNTANVYRDSEGRTRRDQTIGSIGPFAAQGDPPQTVFINDPVAGVHYILDQRTRSARKLPRFEYKIEYGSEEFKSDLKRREKIEKEAAGQPKKSGDDADRLRMERETAETRGFVITTPGPLVHGEGPHGPGPDVRFFGGPASSTKANTEKLPAQLVEGVMAEGTRTTITIAAGEIGNEQPINIVSERWYSPELQTVVMTRHSDPRFGENTYKLTNISRAEPAATLFQVPGDYAVKEAGPLMRKMRTPGLPRKPAPGDPQ